MSIYAFAHIVHLFCAIAFVGGVFFETLILSAIRSKHISRTSRKEVEKTVSQRAARVMPFIVAGLLLSGLVLAHRYAPVLSQPLDSPFAIQLGLKIALALSVFIHFVIAVRKMRKNTLSAAWSKYIHKAVFIHMILIVLLAKTMFYLSW